MDALGLVDFRDLGFDAIPLWAGTKEPLRDGWQRVEPAVQWLDAPTGCNAGLRGGGAVRATYLDCDDLATWETARHWAAGLGYMPDGDYPIVSTAHDMRHLYMRSADSLPGHWKRLRRDFGKGELRFGPASFVVAPGSVVDGREYRLLAGDLRQLPRLERADLRELIDLDTSPVLRIADAPAVPRLARAILRGDADVCGRYPSRSEAEAAAITALINSGHDFGSVLALFQTNSAAGKYAELRQHSERDALRWLRRTFDVQATWAETHESAGRRVARVALAWVMSQPWPGRTGNSNRAVMLAHCAIAYRAGALTYAASLRRLAELAGVGCPAAYRANRRLMEAGLVTFEHGHFGTAAAAYALGEVQSDNTSSRTPCGEVLSLCPSSDAWRYRGLGKSAAHVWGMLRENPGATVAELADATGKRVSTVRRVIDRMTRIVDPESGEVLTLVEADGDGWRAVEADLDAIARAIGTAGTGERQKAQHTADRERWRSAIERQQPILASHKTEKNTA